MRRGRAGTRGKAFYLNGKEREKERGKCNGKGYSVGNLGVKPEVSGSSTAPGFQNRIPKETGMGVGMGLTIAEKL